MLSINYSFTLAGDYYYTSGWRNNEQTEVIKLFNSVETELSKVITKNLRFNVNGHAVFTLDPVYMAGYSSYYNIISSAIFIQNNNTDIFSPLVDGSEKFEYSNPYLYIKSKKDDEINYQKLTRKYEFKSGSQLTNTLKFEVPNFNKIYVLKKKDDTNKTITYTKTFHYAMRYGWNCSCIY